MPLPPLRSLTGASEHISPSSQGSAQAEPLAHMALSGSPSGLLQSSPGPACASQVPPPTLPGDPKHKSPGAQDCAVPSVGRLSQGSPSPAPGTHVASTASVSAISHKPERQSALVPQVDSLASKLLRQFMPAEPSFKQPAEFGPHW